MPEGRPPKYSTPEEIKYIFNKWIFNSELEMVDSIQYHRIADMLISHYRLDIGLIYFNKGIIQKIQICQHK